MAAETWFLTTGGPGAQVVFPRRMRLELESGSGRLHFSGNGALDARWRESAENAWAAARGLSGCDGMDAHLKVVAANPLTGASAGMSLGVLCLASLLNVRSLAPHLCTGGILPDGMAFGGLAAQQKAAFAARAMDAMGIPGCVFVCPPGSAEAVAGIRVRQATDLATAFAQVCPEMYPKIATRHGAARAAAAASCRRMVDVSRPFIIGASGGRGDTRTEEVCGIQIVHVPGAQRPRWMLFGDKGQLLWRAPVATEYSVDELVGFLQQVRRAAVAPVP